MPSDKYDVAVIGGSFSGMSAALQLARAARRVAVIDDNEALKTRILPSHGMLGSDGMPPSEIAGHARTQLLRYPNVSWINENASDLGGSLDKFSIALTSESKVEARRVILALGTEFSLPPIDGIDMLWGKTAFNCPYCHAYEHKGGKLAVLRVDTAPIYEALLYPDWGNVTLLMDGQELPDAETRLVAQRGTSVDTRGINRLELPCRVVFDDGQSSDFSALFLSPIYSVPLFVRRTECDVVSSSRGNILKVDSVGKTSVDGIYGCGTVATANATLPDVVASGAKVGKAVHASFYFSTMAKG